MKFEAHVNARSRFALAEVKRYATCMGYLTGLWRNITYLTAIVKYFLQTETVRLVKVGYVSDLTFSLKSGSHNYHMGKHSLIFHAFKIFKFLKLL